MNKRNLYLLSILMLSVLLPSLFIEGCSHSRRIDEDKFVKIYTDIVIAQDTANANKNQIDEIKSKVFNRYDVTPALYDSTLSYYNSNPQRWEKFFDKTIKYVEGLRDRSKKKEKRI